MDSGLHDFITSCVHKVPDRRPTVVQLLQHPFITSYCGPFHEESLQADEQQLVAQDQEVILAWLQEAHCSSNKRGSANGKTRHARSTSGNPLGQSPETTVHSNPTRSAEPSVNLDDELNRLLF
ncbi:hypothetical protein ADEAN_000161500 [Angomonas deanei]|uniref:Protein kinase domain containing protein n=1 Tax=Angomonas deanei TaxID=59799 RepID=A0A7G2C4P1_9TRYP|nr:hypothetical protein ADEAN_000161500 [Angomonas deanei]